MGTMALNTGAVLIWLRENVGLDEGSDEYKESLKMMFNSLEEEEMQIIESMWTQTENMKTRRTKMNSMIRFVASVQAYDQRSLDSQTAHSFVENFNAGFDFAVYFTRVQGYISTFLQNSNAEVYQKMDRDRRIFQKSMARVAVITHSEKIEKEECEALLEQALLLEREEATKEWLIEQMGVHKQQYCTEIEQRSRLVPVQSSVGAFESHIVDKNAVRTYLQRLWLPGMKCAIL